MNNTKKRSIEVCFSPQLIQFISIEGEMIVVVVDILRATTSMISAIANGAGAVIPVSDIEQAKSYQKSGCLVAAERDGSLLDFADFGNSAFEFQNGRINGKTLVFSTTNGTVAVEMAKKYGEVVLGTFGNLTVLAEYLTGQDKNVLIICSGWKNAFCLEDTIFAGALAEKLLTKGGFSVNCDAAMAAIDLWSVASHDVMAYIEKAAHRERLRQLGVDDVLEFSFRLDTMMVVPVLREGKFVKAEGRV